MLRRLYDWTLSLAARKSAEVWLAVIAFIESSVFLVPADVLYLPMALARPERAYRYALTATIASTLGGVAGYFLGAFAYDVMAAARSCHSRRARRVRALRRCAGAETTMVLLVTSGLAHLPPIKIVTILSGRRRGRHHLLHTLLPYRPRRPLLRARLGAAALGRADQGVHRTAPRPHRRPCGGDPDRPLFHVASLTRRRQPVGLLMES